MIVAIGMDQATVDRFHDNTRPEGECVVWTGELDEDGYGRFRRRIGGRQRLRWMAHRFAHFAMVGEIPEGYEVDHLCRNRACVLPDHLEAVTPRENHDRWSTRITACPKGHEYTPENTSYNSAGGRRCRTCVREAARQYRAANPEKAEAAVSRYRAKKAGVR